MKKFTCNGFKSAQANEEGEAETYSGNGISSAAKECDLPEALKEKIDAEPIGKSVEGYLIAAAMEMCPAECAANLETLKAWMSENMKAIAERASAMQSDFLNRFFKSDAMQDEAKRILCGRVWKGARK